MRHGHRVTTAVAPLAGTILEPGRHEALRTGHLDPRCRDGEQSSASSTRCWIALGSTCFVSPACRRHAETTLLLVTANSALYFVGCAKSSDPGYTLQHA